MSQFFASGGQRCFSISPSNGYLVLISFRIDWFDLLGAQGTLKSLLQHRNSKASVLRCSALFMVQLSHPFITTGKNWWDSTVLDETWALTPASNKTLYAFALLWTSYSLSLGITMEPVSPALAGRFLTTWPPGESDAILTAWNRDALCKVPSVMLDSAIPWTVACKAPLFVGFSRQEY